MPVKVDFIHENSIAESLPIKSGDEILSIDKEPINDILDMMFFSQRDQFTIDYKSDESGTQRCHVINNFDKPLGFDIELPECVSCVNRCIFCFIDQMPKGMRQSLYVKDDDFIHSFFYGNFITMTNLSPKAIKKIIRQHISPLYVSVHSTNHLLHKKMLRYKNNFHIMKALKVFSDANIEIHAQIVLISGINDKEELFKTLTDLLDMENISTIGIVPVGVTKFRAQESGIRKHTKAEAVELISHVEFMKNMRKIDHVYLADEFFVLADLPIPNDDYYHGYEQIENGIGMIRKSWENWQHMRRKFLRLLNRVDGNPVFITSASGIHAINPILKEVQKGLKNKQVTAHVIKNNLFGEEVTVTGLLSWQDIKEQLKLKENEYPVFSSSIFNHEMLTLDGKHVLEIKDELKKEVYVIDELFTDWRVY